MELALNLTWMLLSLAMVTAWFAQSGHKLHSRDRRRAAIALLLLVVILLPAISMTDDLLAARFSAEVEQIQMQHKSLLVAHAEVALSGLLAMPVTTPQLTARYAGAVEVTPPQQALEQAVPEHGVRPPPAGRIA